MPNVHFTKKDGKYAIALSYSPNEIKDLAEKGLFLEAFGRLDKMMDQACFGLMHQHFNDEKLVSALVDDELSGLEACKVLYRTGVLDKKTFQDIKNFKNDRNTVTHDIYGHYALALRQAGEIRDEADLRKKADAKAQSALQKGLDAFHFLMASLKR
ncbi:hypothetical protein HY572_06730 [Candidatus Micrarchaeota archaeon]|nr:hypothetical protein [Candidatus Micrarchaeota archaeon]